jgi:hypothetical protein
LARGQEPVKLSSADLELNLNHIVVSSSSPAKDFNAALSELGKSGNWNIKLRGTEIKIVDLSIDLANRAIYLDYRPGSFSVLDNADIPKGDLTVTYSQVTVLTVLTGKDAHPVKPGGVLRGCLAWKLTKDKKKADIDITGGLQAGVGAKPQYNWSAKASCDFVQGSFGEIGPSFTAEASQQNNADPDSMKAGITWVKNIAPPGTRNGWKLSGDLLSYEFERKINKEAVLAEGKAVDQQYLTKNSNLMWSGKAAFVNGSPQLNSTLTFIGFEAGKALSRTVKKDSQSSNDQTVARLYFAFDPYWTLFYKDKAILTFHGNQTLRLPFHPEPYSEAGVNGGQMYLTNKPRHWSLVELTFPFTDGVALNLQYKRGSLPPSFEFVNHQITIGVNLLFKHGS